MRLHAKNIARMAGVPDSHLDRVAETMVAEGNVRMNRAKEIWEKLRTR
jgi:hydroxymethylglutaryl-CoA reductase